MLSFLFQLATFQWIEKNPGVIIYAKCFYQDTETNRAVKYTITHKRDHTL